MKSFSLLVRPLFIFFTLILFFSIFSSAWLYPVFGHYELLRFILAGLLVVGSGVFLWRQSAFAFVGSGLGLGLAWSLLLLPSTLLHLSSAAWLEPYQYAAFVALFLSAGHCLARQSSILPVVQALLSAVVVVLTLYSVYSVFTYIFILLDGKTNIHEHLPWGFINIRYWSQVASWLLPILPLALLAHPLSNQRYWRMAVYFNFAVWVWILLLSTARGSGLALICSMIFIGFIFKEHSKSWLTIMLKGAALGIFTWLLFSIAIPELFLDKPELRNFVTNSSGRIPLWREALAMSWQNFPLGMGPFSWVNHERITEAYKASDLYGHPHFMLLFWAAEYGWLAVLPLFGLVLHGGKVITRVRKTASVELVAITASVIAALIHSCFSAVFITPYSMLVGLIVLSIFWGYIQQHNPNLNTPASITSKVFMRTLALAFLLLGLTWLNYIYNYHQALQHELYDSEIEVIGRMSPRFWSNSHIISAEDAR